MTPQDESYREIYIGRGCYAIVDTEDYDRSTTLSWNIDRLGYARAHAKNGYSDRVKGVLRPRPLIRLHQFIMNAATGSRYDHKDGDKLNNRKSNLRSATQQQNCFNKKPQNGRRFKGTEQCGRRWRAVIRHNGVAIHDGPFDREVDAALAYNRLAIHYFGDFARLNNIEVVE